MSDSAKYRLAAKRSGTAGIVICISWGITLLTYFASETSTLTTYSMRLAHCLLVVLPIPAVAVGLWSLRGLNRKEHRQEMGNAVFGIISGLLTVIAVVFLIIYMAENIA